MLMTCNDILCDDEQERQNRQCNELHVYRVQIDCFSFFNHLGISSTLFITGYVNLEFAYLNIGHILRES